METYKKDPKHPDAHPIHDGSKVKRIEYDESLLSPGQKHWQTRRVWRREEMKKRRLERERKEREAREAAGTTEDKVHMMYSDPYPGITPHDLDGRAPRCTECEVPLWGTKYVYPLWQRRMRPHRVLVAPYCLGCERLFSINNVTMKDKIAIIRWLVCGVHRDLENDDPVKNLNFDRRAKSMKTRARSMRGQVLYDHPSWKFLKSEKELMFEFKMAHPNLKENSIKRLIEKYIKQHPGITRVPPAPIAQVEVASGEELKQLVIDREAKDAIAGQRCSSVPKSEISISFDHIEPCSKVRYRPGSYSIANLQILSKCLNRVKGDYPNKELGRWLSQLLDAYEEKY